MRLIDSDALADALFEQHKNYPQWVADTIGSMAVIDSVSVVRCKDCKFYQKPEFGFTIGDCKYGSVWYQTGEDDFCSKGKAKE